MKKALLIQLIMIVVLACSVFASPTLTSITSPQSFNEGDVVSFTITTSSGPDNGSSVWILDDNVPVSSVSTSTIGANSATLTRIGDTSATFSSTAPTVDTNTDYSVKFGVNDTNSSDTQTVTLTVVNVQSGLAATSIAFGGENQQRSNSKLDDDDDDYYISDESTFTITNQNTGAIASVQLTWPSASKYNISYVSHTVNAGNSPATTDITNGVQFSSIEGGQTVTVTLKALIPEDLDSFYKSRSNPQSDRALDIGDLTISASGYTTVNTDATMEAENRLEIDKLEICINDDCDTYKDDDEVENIEPGADIEIRLIAENKYSDNDDLDIENVDFSFFVDDGDLEEDEEEDMGDIKADDKETGTIKINLDDDIDEDTYKIEIMIVGDDENEATHGEFWEIDFTVEKEDELIKIRQAEVDENVIRMCENDPLSTKLRVRIENQGKDDSDEIVFVAKNDPINFYHRTIKIDLDESDDWSKTITLSVPEDTKPGTYQISAYTYFNFDDYEDESINSYASFDLKVEACPSTSKPDNGNDNGGDNGDSGDSGAGDETVIVITPPVTPNTGDDTSSTGGAVAVPVSQSTPDSEISWLYMAGLVIGCILLFGIAVLLVLNLMKPSK